MPDLVALREDSELLRLDLVLPGIVENVRNALEEANGVLLAAKEQENTTSKFAQARKTYDCSIVELASKWFNVLPEAIEKLTPERRKELEELVLRKAGEDHKGLIRVHNFLRDDIGNMRSLPALWFLFSIFGFYGGFGVMFFPKFDFSFLPFFLGSLSVVSISAICLAESLFSRNSTEAIQSLLKSHKLLNGDKE